MGPDKTREKKRCFEVKYVCMTLVLGLVPRPCLEPRNPTFVSTDAEAQQTKLLSVHDQKVV